jgi:hypothetical protein
MFRMRSALISLDTPARRSGESSCLLYGPDGDPGEAARDGIPRRRPRAGWPLSGTPSWSGLPSPPRTGWAPGRSGRCRGPHARRARRARPDHHGDHHRWPVRGGRRGDPRPGRRPGQATNASDLGRFRSTALAGQCRIVRSRNAQARKPAGRAHRTCRSVRGRSRRHPARYLRQIRRDRQRSDRESGHSLGRAPCHIRGRQRVADSDGRPHSNDKTSQ